MKNLRTKIGVSLAALTCFLTLGLTPKIAGSVLSVTGYPEERSSNIKNFSYENQGRDPEVMRVAEIVKEKSPDSYKTSDGKTISFSYEESYKYGISSPVYLQLEISEESSKNKIFIIDYELDNLDEHDIIRYGHKTYSYLMMGSVFQGKSFGFGKLSKDLQTEIRNEYNQRIREAPKKLSEVHANYQQKKQQEKEQVMEEFEDNVLGVLR